MSSHVCHSGGLLGGVCRGGGCWCWRIASSGTRLSTSTSHGIADVENARSKVASLIDRGSHSGVARHGFLVDDKNVLGAVGRPGSNYSAMVNAQGLRRGCHQRSVGGRLWPKEAAVQTAASEHATAPRTEERPYGKFAPWRWRTTSWRASPPPRGARGSRLITTCRPGLAADRQEGQRRRHRRAEPRHRRQKRLAGTTDPTSLDLPPLLTRLGTR
jgi:hypothetical protein